MSVGALIVVGAVVVLGFGFMFLRRSGKSSKVSIRTPGFHADAEDVAPKGAHVERVVAGGNIRAHDESGEGASVRDATAAGDVDVKSGRSPGPEKKRAK